ncbi:hypothetical protein CR203_07645 [Salipaludibacillus neizhouensis]|uniref:DUF2920 family protein n=1 Tax=Salipaludibacillus neizhouensis TaxID=885475 RepID=A0A3A9KKL8_9BACI|nr:DUF2920 family protein [Salipaludibacillus neizhouensis]RKL68345.1 hypothetical protein CR203_07645 [Salipaludibacillus neizhouensis]
MSEQQSFNIIAHHNIYTGTSGRELRIDFSVPQNGVNTHTGLLIFVPGFGGNIDSKVYKKMRGIFADQYNMITIQCEYFGSEFMQTADNYSIQNKQILHNTFTDEELEQIKIDSSMLLKLLKNKKKILPVKAKIDEKVEGFNDMSYMQAIDIITAIEAVKIVLDDNKLEFNRKRTIGYGHSHGAYLLHLCNVLVPNLFSYIIDNSAWIEPVYITGNRHLYHQIGFGTLDIEFEYLAKKIIKNKKDLNLNVLYENYPGNTQILSFQGNDDNLVNHKNKQKLIEGLFKSLFILVTEKDIDNKKYNSNAHGLNADFLELFTYALEYELPIAKIPSILWGHTVSYSGVEITNNNKIGLPVFKFIFMEN